MRTRRMGMVIGAIAGLVAMVDWIGELDLDLEDAVASEPPAAATDSKPPRSNPSFSKP